jgi:FkbM family methyltransferase
VISVDDERSTDRPRPTPISPQQPIEPSTSWLRRGVAALAHGRLPYRLQGPYDRIAVRLGGQYRRLDADGFRLVVRRRSAWDENSVSRVIIDRDYARPNHEIRDDDTIIDIGGNIGCFTLVAARAARRGRVLVFEPDRDNFELLTRNVSLNALTNVIAAREAVGAEPGVLRLFKGQEGQLHTTVASRGGEAGESEEVPTVTLRQIMDQHNVSRCFLKMNCEGAEYGILYNTPRDYLRRIDRIALEYHQVGGEDKVVSGSRLAAFLQDQGFEVFEFTDFIGFDCGYIRAVRRG